MKKENNFSAKVQPLGVAYFCLFFCQFQPGVAYKSVAYKKSVYLYWRCHAIFLSSFRHEDKTFIKPFSLKFSNF